MVNVGENGDQFVERSRHGAFNSYALVLGTWLFCKKNFDTVFVFAEFPVRLRKTNGRQSKKAAGVYEEAQIFHSGRLFRDFLS
jgi:hypothetical protein